MAKVRVESLTLSVGGKGASVRRKVNNKVENVCLCWYNIDGSRGCVSQVPVELMREVVSVGTGMYADGNFRKYKREGIILNQKCSYCYGRWLNNRNIFPRAVNEKTRASFEKHKPDFVRGGKFTEIGHPYFYKNFMAVLDLCNEFGSRLIFTTKAFPFGLRGARETQKYARNRNTIITEIAESMKMMNGERLAEKLIDNKSSLLYGLGFNTLEQGLCSQGFTDAWKIKQTQYFHKEGVNVSLTVVADLGQSIEENSRLGSLIKKALKLRERGLNVRLLPLRINSRDISEFLYGCGYKGIIFDGQPIVKRTEHMLAFPVIDGVEMKPYMHKNNVNRQELIVKHPHKDFQELIDDGIGVCGQVGDYEHCDKCNMFDERIKFPVSELVEREKKKKYKRGKKRDKHPKLF
jgi:hypothetical protein